MRQQVTSARIRLIKDLLEGGVPIGEVAERLGLSESTIRKVRYGCYDRGDGRDGRPPRAGRVAWCPRCRCHVVWPCQMCRVRDYLRGQPPTARLPRPEGVGGPQVVARLEMSVAEIGLPVRVVNSLQQHGIFTVNDLLHCTAGTILGIPNCGRKTLECIYKSLEALGFSRQGASD